MSHPALAQPRPIRRHLRAVEDVASESAGRIAPLPLGASTRAASALPAEPAPRGFALYVGLDERTAAAAGVSLSTVVSALRRTLAELVPQAESHAAVALAPTGAGGRDVDIVRRALHEPAAAARTKSDEPAERVAGAVTIDISRRRVHIDGETAALTFTEFELLQYLVLREGRTIERTELVASLWSRADADEAPGERTIDVHVRRLRAKLGRYADIVRTVRGAGYRFDRHADVVVDYGHGAPSPDRF